MKNGSIYCSDSIGSAESFPYSFVCLYGPFRDHQISGCLNSFCNFCETTKILCRFCISQTGYTLIYKHWSCAEASIYSWLPGQYGCHTVRINGPPQLYLICILLRHPGDSSGFQFSQYFILGTSHYEVPKTTVVHESTQVRNPNNLSW